MIAFSRSIYKVQTKVSDCVVTCDFIKSCVFLFVCFYVMVKYNLFRDQGSGREIIL